MAQDKIVIKGASGRDILVDFTPADDCSPLIIFIHGFKGFKDWGAHNLLAKHFAANKFNFLKFNFSHNGTTVNAPADFEDLNAFGENTFTKELSDLNAVTDHACSGKDFAQPKSIYLLGHSRGGGIGIIQASEDKRVKKLVTWASVSRFNNMWDKAREGEWRRDGVIYTENARTKQSMPLNLTLLEDLEQHAGRLNILSAASKIQQPWLICHGDADKGVPVAQAYELKEQNSLADLYIIPGGDHVFGASHPYNSAELPQQLKQLADRTIVFLKG